MVDVAQLYIFIRMVFDNMKGHPRCEDIFQAFREFANKFQLPLCKLVSITTDGAPAMVGGSGSLNCAKNMILSRTFLDITA